MKDCDRFRYRPHTRAALGKPSSPAARRREPVCPWPPPRPLPPAPRRDYYYAVISCTCAPSSQIFSHFSFS